jgi:hypothetical protein
LVVLLSLLSACAAARTDLVEANAVEVKVVPTSRSSIRYVSVDATSQETVVSGQVKRLGVYNNAFLGARVYAEAVYPDGSKQFEVDDLLQRMPRFRNFRMIYPDAKFRIVFPEPLPIGTTLYLKFAAPGAVQSASLREAL